MRARIEKTIYGGSGLARTPEGKVLLVPFTLPGEEIELAPSSEEGRLRETRALAILQPSPERVQPRCRHFGVCGGCQYQHAAYPLQPEMKRAILGETLERAGVHDLPPIQPHADAPWEYRNRIRLRVEAGSAGEILLGYNLRGTDQFLHITECPISAPVLWRCALALQQFAAEDTHAAAWLHATAEVELSCTNDQAGVQVLLLLRNGGPRDINNFGAGLQRRLPELRGAGAVFASVRGRAAPRAQAAWGADGLPMEAGGLGYWVSRGSFFQINRTLADTLSKLVIDGRRGALAWDLFAGVGLFARGLAESFGEVVAVEASPGSSRDLELARRARVRVVGQPVLAFLRGAVLQRDRPDLIVLDPPRAGVGAEAARLLTGLRPREIVYVSCDPATLGRDLRAMVDSGYNLAELHLVDLFPQTFHLETVAVLQRA